jgi:hypothetical protein
MLRVDINLLPGGNKCGEKVITSLFITNVSGIVPSKQYDNYAYCLYAPKSEFNEEIFKIGFCLEYSRNQPVHILVGEVLNLISIKEKNISDHTLIPEGYNDKHKEILENYFKEEIEKIYKK